MSKRKRHWYQREQEKDDRCKFDRSFLDGLDERIKKDVYEATLKAMINAIGKGIQRDGIPITTTRVVDREALIDEMWSQGELTVYRLDRINLEDYNK